MEFLFSLLPNSQITKEDRKQSQNEIWSIEIRNSSFFYEQKNKLMNNFLNYKF